MYFPVWAGRGGANAVGVKERQVRMNINYGAR